MVPPKDDREKAALPFDAEPVALHLRLVQVERSNRVILKRLTRMQTEIKADVADGFKKCSESRPCAKTPAVPVAGPFSIDWPVWGPVIKNVLVGAGIIGALIGGFSNTKDTKDAKPVAPISAPVVPANNP